jgi:hypothetical protein
MNWKLLIVLCLATCSFACDKEIREARPAHAAAAALP